MTHIPSIMRKQDYLKGVLEVLDEEVVTEYEFIPPSGRGHYSLRMVVDGEEIRVTLPGTPSGHGEAKFYVVATVRRRIRMAREIAKSKKTVDNPDETVYK